MMQAEQKNIKSTTTTTTTKQRDGLGFMVENLLSDLTNNNNDDDKFDKIKQSILKLYKKIKERKCYNNNNNKNNNNKNDAVFSYINYSKVKEQYRELLKTLF